MGETFEELTANFPLKTLESEDDLTKALAIMENIITRQHELNEDEVRYGASLSELIQRYEAYHWGGQPIPPRELLTITRTDLENMLRHAWLMGGNSPAINADTDEKLDGWEKNREEAIRELIEAQIRVGSTV